MRKLIKKILKIKLGLIVFCAIIYYTLSHLSLPTEPPVKIVSPFQLAAFNTGLALYENSRNRFFSISAFDDYIIDGNDQRISLIDQSDVRQSNFSVYKISKYADLVVSYLLSHFNLFDPYISFLSKNAAVTYESHIQGDNLLITKTLYPRVNFSKTGFTLILKPGDVVIDSDKKIVNLPDSSSVDNLNLQWKQNLSLPDTSFGFYKTYPNKPLILVNTAIPGAIAIYPSANQKIIVNLEQGEINIEQDFQRISTLNLRLFDNLSQAITSL